MVVFFDSISVGICDIPGTSHELSCVGAASSAAIGYISHISHLKPKHRSLSLIFFS